MAGPLEEKRARLTDGRVPRAGGMDRRLTRMAQEKGCAQRWQLAAPHGGVGLTALLAARTSQRAARAMPLHFLAIRLRIAWAASMCR